jgi:outer membrane protein TolC
MSFRLSQLACSLGLLLGCSSSAWSGSLPEPLTLSAVLAVASEQSPEVMLAQADLSMSQGTLSSVDSKDAFKLAFEGGLVKREFAGKDEDYHNAYLVLQKQLYDFGKQSANLSSAEAQVRAQEWLLAQAQLIYRQQIIEAYFDVLLADMVARVENEQMAIEYVGLDNARDELTQGKLSELAVLALDEVYQKTLVRNTQAGFAQRSTRAKLVELLGLSGQLPDELEMPDVSGWDKRHLEDPKVLQQKAIADNLHLKALAEQVNSAELALTTAEKMDAPTIEFRGRNGWHTNIDTMYEGRYRYDLAVTMPLVDGGVKAAEVDKAKARLHQQKARYEQMLREVRQLTLDTALKISLLKSRQAQTKVQGDYAERYLDKSRTEYQFERKTDLGDSLVRVSRADLETLKLTRDKVVLWEQLLRLTGEKP